MHKLLAGWLALAHRCSKKPDAGMKVRAFGEQDRAAVIALWQACGLTAPQNDPNKDIDRKLRVDPDLFLVGEDHRGIVASVMAGYEGHRGWISYLAVSPASQRQGLGQIIMHEAEKRLLTRGCPKINLQVRAGNRAVLGFYATLGYLDDDVMGLGKRLIPD